MTLFATCPSCTIEMWRWQRTCSACVAAFSPSSLGSPGTVGRPDAADGPSRIRQMLVGVAVAVGRVVTDYLRAPLG